MWRGAFYTPTFAQLERSGLNYVVSRDKLVFKTRVRLHTSHVGGPLNRSKFGGNPRDNLSLFLFSFFSRAYVRFPLLLAVWSPNSVRNSCKSIIGIIIFWPEHESDLEVNGNLSLEWVANIQNAFISNPSSSLLILAQSIWERHRNPRLKWRPNTYMDGA